VALTTWTWDAPSGVFKNQHLSAELYKGALANTVFPDHARTVGGYGRKRGESVTFGRVAALAEPTDPTLVEGTPIPQDELRLSTATAVVQEIGRAVPYTNLLDDLSTYDMENPIQQALRDQMALTLDSLCATAFKTQQVKYVPTAADASTITTNGVPGAEALVNMSMWHVERIRDYMFDTLFVPPIDGDYVAIFRTQGLRGIKDDPEWEDWHRYTDPTVKFNSEVGRMEQVRFIESNHATALGKVGQAAVLGEGVVFGRDAVALAEATSPELRAGIPSDYGRSKGVAWYGTLKFTGIWADSGNAGEARVVHVTST
jgi:N4-gp56 family major capsid protein